MPHLNGLKQRGKHTSLIDLAAKAIKSISSLPEINGISPGFISTGINRKNNIPTLKITNGQGYILLTAIQKNSKQEIKIYTNNFQQIKLALIKWTKENRYILRFKNQDKK